MRPLIWLLHAIIKDYLRRGRLIIFYRVPSLKTIIKEIMGDVNYDWLSKGLLVSLNLSVKCKIIYKIGVANRIPYSYRWGITSTLASLLYYIGTRVALNFRDYAFDQVVKKAKSYEVELPIVFTSLISGILIKQKSDIVIVEDEIGVSPRLLNFSDMLFAEKHVPYIMLSNVHSIDESNLTVDKKHLMWHPCLDLWETTFSRSLCKRPIRYRK